MTIFWMLCLLLMAYLWGQARGESQEAAFWGKILARKDQTIDSLREECNQLRRELDQRVDDEGEWWKQGGKCPY